MNAGFFPGDPRYILCEQPAVLDSLYYDWNTWAKMLGVDGRLPVITAAGRALKGSHTKRKFTANMPAVQETDALTGLLLFMLAGVGPTSDIESVYNFLKEYPQAIKANKPRTSGFFH